MIRAFDIQRPGLCIEQWNTFGNFSFNLHSILIRKYFSDRTNSAYQSGIISCLSFNSQISGMYAAGSYAKTSR
jgi:hypothetical protein